MVEAQKNSSWNVRIDIRSAIIAAVATLVTTLGVVWFAGRATEGEKPWSPKPRAVPPPSGTAQTGDRGHGPPPEWTPGTAQTGDREFLLQALPKTKLVVTKTDQAAQYKGVYKFGADHFSRCLPVWEEALKPFKGKADLHYLEVGVFEGRSALWVLENICTHPTARVTGIDVNDLPVLLSNISASGEDERFTFIKGSSQVELRELPLESFDIIYIDGDHNAGPVLEDAVLCWRLLKPGGVMMFDDYGTNWDDPALTRPSTAIDSFYRYFGEHFEPIHVGYQVILKRRN